MIKKRILQFSLYWVVVGIGFLILVFFITSTWIGVSVHEKCLIAQGQYEDSDGCTHALMEVVDDPERSNRERNYAIWALGQIGDPVAKSTIEKYYTGEIPDREPYDTTLSQYEMKKALALLGGGVNITHFVWRSANFK